LVVKLCAEGALGARARDHAGAHGGRREIRGNFHGAEMVGALLWRVQEENKLFKRLRSLTSHQYASRTLEGAIDQGGMTFFF